MSTPSGDYTTLVPVTGEAVALDLRIAQFPSRTLALALDLVVQCGVLVAVGLFAVSVASQVDGAAATAIVLVAIVMVIVGMPTLIETLTRGRSLGKLAAGLRVVRDDGGPVRFRHSFVRALFMIIDFWLFTGAVGLISALVSQRSKRLGDHFAGTVVIRERVPAAASIRQYVYAMPPALEGWAASLDLARLPDITAMQARQFLLRTGSIAPQVRSTMGMQLAAEVSSYVAPPPPPGTHPETYLTAVLTERMRRATRTAPSASRPPYRMPPPMLAPPTGVPTRVPPRTAPPAASGVAPTPGAPQVEPPATGPFSAPH